MQSIQLLEIFMLIKFKLPHLLWNVGFIKQFFMRNITTHSFFDSVIYWRQCEIEMWEWESICQGGVREGTQTYSDLLPLIRRRTWGDANLTREEVCKSWDINDYILPYVCLIVSTLILLKLRVFTTLYQYSHEGYTS